jgi:hypothetical protein
MNIKTPKDYMALVPSNMLIEEFDSMRTPFPVYAMEGDERLWYSAEDVQLVYGPIRFQSALKFMPMHVAPMKSVYIVQSALPYDVRLN